ncbi:MAG: hypothetical protein ACRCRP_03335 [Metamycoplasmataceae bacterium]
MTKKFILNSCIISGSLILASIVAVVTPLVLKQRNNIENKILKINPYSGIINVSQMDIDEMTSTTNSIVERVNALSKLFEGVTEENVNSFIVKKNINSTINLNSKNGYFFNQENINQLNAIYKVVNIINITPKKDIVKINNEEIAFGISAQNTPKKIEILSKLFDGVNEENINNINISKISDSEITLIANEGYGFGYNVVPYLKANIKMITTLNIEAKSDIINVIDKNVISMLSKENTIEKITALSKIFDGINSTNINNIKVEKTSNKEITLTANDGYAFISPTITSIKAKINIVSVLNITPRTVIDKIDKNEIIAIILDTTPLEKKVDILFKLFVGVTLQNVNNFKVKKLSNTEIILIANEGYAFGELLEFGIKVDILDINESAKVLNITPFSGFVNFTKEEIVTILSIENSIEKVHILSKLFIGVTEENINNFKVEKTSTNEITLIANDGYVFGSKNLKKISRNIDSVVTILNITPKSGPVKTILKKDVDIMTSLENTTDKLNAIKLLFDNVNEMNIYCFTVSLITDIDGNKFIKLTSKRTYVFGKQYSPYITVPIILSL